MCICVCVSVCNLFSIFIYFVVIFFITKKAFVLKVTSSVVCSDFNLIIMRRYKILRHLVSQFSYFSYKNMCCV